MKRIIFCLLFLSVTSAQANTLATISVNPVRVELSKMALESIREFDPHFIVHEFDDYSEKVKEIFFKDIESLNRETPMVALGYFDCDNTLDMAVMGTSKGKDVILALVSSQGFKVTVVPGTPKSKNNKRVATAAKSDSYISLNSDIPVKAKTCRGARKTVDLIQAEEAYSANTHAFYLKRDKWVLYTGQDL